MKVATIPAGTSFVDALAGGLIARAGATPEQLARVLVLLPTRRACRALGEAFLRQAKGAALMLPRMVPIGDLDEDAALIEAPFDDPELPPAMPPLRRLLLLTRLVQEFTGALPAQAARLAAELGRLVDQVATERLSFDRLGGLAPAEYAEHWQKTLKFLEIVTQAWPKVLAEAGMLDAAERRDRAIARQARLWLERPPAHPVIAAGSTGTIPATAELLNVVATLPHGQVVLPGFDRTLDADTLAVLGPTHPQYGMAQLITRMGLKPADVQPWDGTREMARARAIAAALQPAEAKPRTPDEEAIAAVRAAPRIECAGAQEEAATIALILRGALETPGKTAALITPDRALARRVAAELRRWDIEADDSAGQPLGATPPGVFLRLTARLAADGGRVALLAALKHPLAAGGMEPGAFRARVRASEVALRQNRTPDQTLIDIAAPFRGAAQGRQPVRTLLDAHLRFAETLAATADQTGAQRLWSGDAGETAAEFAHALAESAAHLAPIDARDYAALFETLMDGYVVRPRYGLHPRLKIWGLLEARLQHADLLVLGGLNDGVWPAEPAPDAWMSRPMRNAFGLPALERRIGLAAHDFAQAFAAPDVIVTRATRHEGAFTVPSRFLARLEALIGKQERPPPWADWQALLDRPAQPPRAAQRPAPCPPLAARPTKLSVTEIETWLRDPYAIYARHVLKLRPLDPLDPDPGAAERGTVIHRALDAFLRAHPDGPPPDGVERLLAFGRRAFGPLLDEPAVYAFWWPRFQRIAHWFVDLERTRRPNLTKVSTEVSGEMQFDDGFRLTAKADRIERRKAGDLVIVDYKTGTVPTQSDIKLGFAPQLALEAMMAAAGNFTGVAPAAVAALAHWRMTGAREAGEEIGVAADPAELAAAAEAGLRDLIALFADPAAPYHSQPDPAHAPRYSDYAHLARVREWSAGGGDEP